MPQPWTLLRLPRPSLCLAPHAPRLCKQVWWALGSLPEFLGWMRRPCLGKLAVHPYHTLAVLKPPTCPCSLWLCEGRDLSKRPLVSRATSGTQCPASTADGLLKGPAVTVSPARRLPGGGWEPRWQHRWPEASLQEDLSLTGHCPAQGVGRVPGWARSGPSPRCSALGGSFCC